MNPLFIFSTPPDNNLKVFVSCYQLILDLFNGTGITGRSAQLLERRYVGYDLNPTFIKQSEIRMNMPLETDFDLAA